MRTNVARMLGLFANGGVALFIGFMWVKNGTPHGDDLAGLVAICVYVALNSYIIWSYVASDDEIQELERQLAKADLRKRIRDAEEGTR